MESMPYQRHCPDLPMSLEWEEGTASWLAVVYSLQSRPPVASSKIVVGSYIKLSNYSISVAGSWKLEKTQYGGIEGSQFYVLCWK